MNDVVKRDNGRRSHSDKARQKRKRVIRVYMQIIFTIVFLIMIILSLTIFFNIEKITVTGDGQYDESEIIAASGLEYGENMFLTKMSKHADSIMQSVVYLESCEVKRKLPTGIEISVKVCKPLACLEAENDYLIMSTTGKIFERSETPVQGLYLIKGSEPIYNLEPGMMFESADDEGKLNAMLSVCEAMNTRQTEKVSYIDVTDRYNIKYLFDDRVEVRLGSVNELDYKLKFTEIILSEKIGSKTEGVLTMFNGSASFLEKSGIEQYYQNIEDRKNGISETEAVTDENGNIVETESENDGQSE
ncbi:MAG: FtsQ-type POTRA domain-containing protein [Ruminococcus sp.]|nr:FtsQ-type POTRA domain-containing protein [Ruminococcus sp.]